MSWIQKLYETYELCAAAPQFASEPLVPVSHRSATTHIEIVLNEHGGFLRARLDKAMTIVPATERSRLRTGTNPPPHPLCDKVRYCAGDYKAFGGAKKSSFDQYIKQLREWQDREAGTKTGAVLRYVESATLVCDLVKNGILHCDPSGRLLTAWVSDAPRPEIFGMLAADKETKTRDQGDAVVRWRVEIPGVLVSALWEDPEVAESWVRFDTARDTRRGLCMVTGEVSPLASKHPNGLRSGADMAKLISFDDKAGYTYRGRFAIATQAHGIGSAVTQKAHSALQWLIRRQDRPGFRVGGQVFVAWALGRDALPDPFADTAALFGVAQESGVFEPLAYGGDAGQHFALRLHKVISGYRASLEGAEGVLVMGLDAATEGRLAITFYRELSGSEFLDRLEEWHFRFAWPQRPWRRPQYLGAPSPREIVDSVYGLRVDGEVKIDEKLRKAAVARLVPCIVDSRPLPGDILAAAVFRVVNRNGFEKDRDGESDWENCLGVTCALIRGSRREEKYQMSLEEDRTTRDYLFGRLLAIADNIERLALLAAGEDRETNAARLMQRFADHPGLVTITW